MGGTCVLAGLAMLLLTAVPLIQPVDAAPAAKRGSITITADEMDIDAASGRVTATGRVRVTDGSLTATGGRATLYQAERRAVLAEGAKVSGPQGTLQAAEIEVSYTTTEITRVVARGSAGLQIQAGRLSAPTLVILPAGRTITGEGGVTFSSPPDITATGSRLTYDWARATAVLEGGARVQNREGMISGDRIGADQRVQRATVTGSVHGRFRDIEVRSRTAEVFGQENKAVFLGDVRVTQPGRVLTTEKVTVWYSTRRIVAEGQTHVELEPPESRR
jgi:lipopolysaccharide export system protein LptA